MAKKGGSYVCVPCGKEVVVTDAGTAYSETWCCSEVMTPAPKAKAKPAPKKKAAPKRAAARKTVKKAAKKTAPKRKR